MAMPQERINQLWNQSQQQQSQQNNYNLASTPNPISLGNPQAQSYYQQILNAKRVDQAPTSTQQARNQAHMQSNQARQALLGMGIDVSEGAWGKGSTLQQSLDDYNRMYYADGPDLQAAKPYYQQILDAMRVDQTTGNVSARNQSHVLSNQARNSLLGLGIDVSQGDWAKGTNYNQAQAAFDAMYGNPQQQVQQNNLIEDLAAKYGFDYSRDYAQTQAEAMAQAQRDAVAQGRKTVESGVMGAAEALDRNYFQQYMMQAQDQTNRGLNAGIAADQDLRLAMSRQAEMGDVYRDANLRNFELDNMAGRIEQERLAYEEQLYNERLQQAFQNVQTERDFGLREGELTGRYTPEGTNRDEVFNLAEEVIRYKTLGESGALGSDSYAYALNKARADEARRKLAEMGVDVSLLGSNVTAEQARQNLGNLFDTAQMRDSALDRGQQQSQWQQQLDQDDRHFNKQLDLSYDQLDQDMKQFLKQLDWDKEKWNNMSAEQKESFKLAREQLNEQKRQFNTEQEWREYTYNRMSEAERMAFDQNAYQFGVNQTWKEHEFEATLAMQDEYNKTMAGNFTGSTTGGDNLPSLATKNVQRTHASDMAYGAAKAMGLRLTSAYRSPADNKRVGGSPTSKHMQGKAYDFAGTKAQMDKFAKWAKESGLFGQVLWQVKGHYDHVHVSW